jgi:hypothetical protein
LWGDSTIAPPVGTPAAKNAINGRNPFFASE